MPIQDFPLTKENAGIHFLSEELDFKLKNEKLTQEWLKKIIEQEEKSLFLLNFIFCTDAYLHQLNVEYLSHDTLTDVITFQYSNPPTIEGDIFISIERVKENAIEYDVPFRKELYRVMVHGVLHLCGYSDKSPSEAQLMRQKENKALAKFFNHWEGPHENLLG